MKKATKADIEIIKQAFLEHYSDAVTELNYTNDYELLIAISQRYRQALSGHSGRFY